MKSNTAHPVKNTPLKSVSQYQVIMRSEMFTRTVNVFGSTTKGRAVSEVMELEPRLPRCTVEVRRTKIHYTNIKVAFRMARRQMSAQLNTTPRP